MKNLKYFEFDQNSTKKFVLKESYFYDQHELDHKIVLHLVHRQSSNIKSYVNNFLNHHHSYSGVNKQFLNHLESMLISFDAIFKDFASPNKNVDQLIKNWLIGKESKTIINSTKDLAFEDLFEDKSLINPLLKQLQLKEYVSSDTQRWFKNKNELVALFNALEFEAIIKKQPKSAYARIFGKQFQVTISDQLSRKFVDRKVSEPLETIVKEIK